MDAVHDTRHNFLLERLGLMWHEQKGSLLLVNKLHQSYTNHSYDIQNDSVLSGQTLYIQ